jgi:hypothetical protein
MSDKPKIVYLGTGQRSADISEEMANRIKELIYEYSKRTTLAAAIGVLHIVAKELIDDHE